MSNEALEIQALNPLFLDVQWMNYQQTKSPSRNSMHPYLSLQKVCHNVEHPLHCVVSGPFSLSFFLLLSLLILISRRGLSFFTRDYGGMRIQLWYCSWLWYNCKINVVPQGLKRQACYNLHAIEALKSEKKGLAQGLKVTITYLNYWYMIRPASQSLTKEKSLSVVCYLFQ